MRKTVWILCVVVTISLSGGLAWGAVAVKAAPMDQDGAVEAVTKQSANVGPRDPEKEKAHGVDIDLFLNKNLAVSSRVSLLPSDSYLPPGQSGATDGLGLNTSQLGGAVGLKVRF